MKNKVMISATTIALTMLLGFTSCAKYNADSLPLLQCSSAQYTETEEAVTLHCKAFTQADCLRYLDRNVLREGYQPIQIFIQNNSDHNIFFSQEGFELPCVSPNSVARKVHTSTVGRVVGWGVAGLFVWPLWIPAIVDGIGSAKANEQLDRDFADKTVEGQIIPMHSQMNGIVFVPKWDFKNNFQVTLIDQVTEEKINFNVEIAN